MPKLKSPLLSLSAKGSIGKTITFAKTLQGTIAKSIPTHADAKSQSQLAHRRRFINARYYWHALTQSQRNAYETIARQFHMTGWAHFLQHYLATDPNMLLWASLDEAEAGITYDLSSNKHHGTIYGASLKEEGKIYNALYFDGIDDRVNFGQVCNIGTSDFTLMTWIKAPLGGGFRTIITKMWDGRGYYLDITPAGLLEGALFAPPVGIGIPSATRVDDNTWHHVACVFDRDGYARCVIDFTYNGNPVDISGGQGSADSTSDLTFGRWFTIEYYTGYSDEARIIRQALSLQEIKLYALGDLI